MLISATLGLRSRLQNEVESSGFLSKCAEHVVWRIGQCLRCGIAARERVSQYSRSSVVHGRTVRRQRSPRSDSTSRLSRRYTGNVYKDGQHALMQWAGIDVRKLDAACNCWMKIMLSAVVVSGRYSAAVARDGMGQWGHRSLPEPRDPLIHDDETVLLSSYLGLDRLGLEAPRDRHYPVLVLVLVLKWGHDFWTVLYHKQPWSNCMLAITRLID